MRPILGCSLCSLAFCLNTLQNFRISRTEVILGNFRRGDPPEIIVLQQLGNACCNGAVIETQMNREIRVYMIQLHKKRMGRDCNAQFFPAFPDQRLRLCFPGLDLAAYKFPQ